MTTDTPKPSFPPLPEVSQQHAVDAITTGARLASWRDLMQLSQPELGQHLGVHTSTIWKWEQGKTAIPSYLHLALAELRRQIIERNQPMVATRLQHGALIERLMPFMLEQQHLNIHARGGGVKDASIFAIGTNHVELHLPGNNGRHLALDSIGSVEEMAQKQPLSEQVRHCLGEFIPYMISERPLRVSTQYEDFERVLVWHVNTSIVFLRNLGDNQNGFLNTGQSYETHPL